MSRQLKVCISGTVDGNTFTPTGVNVNDNDDISITNGNFDELKNNILFTNSVNDIQLPKNSDTDNSQNIDKTEKRNNQRSIQQNFSEMPKPIYDNNSQNIDKTEKRNNQRSIQQNFKEISGSFEGSNNENSNNEENHAENFINSYLNIKTSTNIKDKNKAIDHLKKKYDKYFTNEEIEKIINDNNLKGGKRRNKTSKRSSGGKRKTSKRNKRRSSKRQ